MTARPKPRLVPSQPSRLHWVRRDEQFAVWVWHVSTSIWHAMPWTIFLTPEQAAAEGWTYHAPAVPPATPDLTLEAT